MDVEVLITYNCPSEDAVVALLRVALHEAGLTRTQIRTTVVTSSEQAEKLGFAGSPTILIDGRDPFAELGQVPALACRIYRGPDGPSGVPDFGVIRRAIQQAAGVPAEDDGGRPGRPLGRG